MYKDNIMVMNVVFNNVNDDTNTRWFSQDRLVSTTFTDLSSAGTFNFFSIDG